MNILHYQLQIHFSWADPATHLAILNFKIFKDPLQEGNNMEMQNQILVQKETQLQNQLNMVRAETDTVIQLLAVQLWDELLHHVVEQLAVRAEQIFITEPLWTIRARCRHGLQEKEKRVQAMTRQGINNIFVRTNIIG